MPADPARRYETIQWVFFQMAAVGPMFGQVGFFHKFAGKDIADKRPLERYRRTNRSGCSVSSRQRSKGGNGSWGTNTRSPISRLLGWVRDFVGFYGAGDLVDYGALEAVPAWLDRALARPAVQRGLNIPARPA